MARFRDFGSPVRVDQDEPVTFRIYGQVFHCAPAIQGRLLLEFIATSGGEKPDIGAAAIINFFNSVLVPQSREEFNRLTTDSDTVVPMETLAEIMEWLVSVYSARPTEPPSPLESGDLTTGPMPMAIPSSVG